MAKYRQLFSQRADRSADFQRLDSNARSTLQAIEDRAENLAKKLNEHEEEAQKVLEEIEQIIGNNEINFEIANKLIYTKMVRSFPGYLYMHYCIF